MGGSVRPCGRGRGALSQVSRATLLEAVGGRGEGELGQPSPPEAHWAAGALGPGPREAVLLGAHTEVRQAFVVLEPCSALSVRAMNALTPTLSAGATPSCLLGTRKEGPTSPSCIDFPA